MINVPVIKINRSIENAIGRATANIAINGLNFECRAFKLNSCERFYTIPEYSKTLALCHLWTSIHTCNNKNIVVRRPRLHAKFKPCWTNKISCVHVNICLNWFIFLFVGEYMPSVNMSTENKALPYRQYCRNWWHWTLSLWQSLVPPVTTRLAAWEPWIYL